MMRSLFAVIVGLPGIMAVAGPACSHFPYKELLPLAEHPAAQNYCSAHFPLSQCTSVVRTSITETFSISVTATDRTITSDTSTEAETTTTGTSTVTQYSSTTTSYVYTTTQTVTSTTATVTRTTNIGDTTITTTTPPTTAFTTATATATLSSGTVTITTDAYNSIVEKRGDREDREDHGDHGDDEDDEDSECSDDPEDQLSDIFSKLLALESSIIKTACACIETQRPCATITSVVSHRTTQTSTIYATAVDDGVTTKTTAVEAFTTLTTGTSTTVSMATTTTVFVEGTVVDSVRSTLITVYTPTAPTDTVTVTVTTTVPKATVTLTRGYDLAFGPADGCAYVGNGYIDQTGGDVPHGATTEEYITLCAQFCDHTPGCVSFGVNYFPPCEGTVPNYYCLVASSIYTSTSQMECGIGTSYNGCSIYQNGTVYK